MTRATGFTLLELVAALGILAVLVSLAAVGGDIYLQRARTARTASDAKVMVTSLRQYQADVGIFAETKDDLMAQPADAPGWRGPYIDRWPKGASWDPAASWTYERQTWFDGFPAWGLAICSGTPPDADLVALVDRIYDDGDASSGTMRLSGNCLKIHVGRDP